MKKTYNISGMHCVSCEIILETELKQVSGIENCQVSHKTGILEVEGEKFSHEQIKDIIEKYGYKLNDENQKNNQKKLSLKNYWEIPFILFGLGFIYFLINKLEIARLFPEINENIGIGLAFLIGIVASISTCLALTGGIVMSFSAELKDQNNRLSDRLKPQILFQIGRIGSFALLGGLLGTVGSKIQYSPAFTGYFTIIIALIMLYIGMNILNIVPSITRWGFHLPKKFTAIFSNITDKKHTLTPLIIGIFTFFLPCGFTQSMQLVAIGSGDFITGALIMTSFALGTAPVLLSIGLGSSYAQNQNFGLVKKTIGVLIIVFALYSINNGFILSGFNSPTNLLIQSKKIESTEIIENQQIIRMDIDYNFNPTVFKLKKDIPVRWEINGINITGCSNEVIIPKLNISSGKLKKGINIVEFTPTEKGILPFSCWMGMINGQFIVE